MISQSTKWKINSYLRYLLFWRKILLWLDKRKRPDFYKHYDEYRNYFNHLFSKAAVEGGFNYILTLTRISGITDDHWDPFEEAREATKQFSKILRKTGSNKHPREAIRMALVIYCHSTEMSAPYEILANLLRIINNKPYQFLPFFRFVRPKSNNPFESIPASVSQKVGLLYKLARQANEEKLNDIITSFLRQDIRNSFYHSDYTITDEEFRMIADGSIPKTMKLEEIAQMLTKCFAFYSAFFDTYNSARKEFLHMKKYHRRNDYDIVEIITDKKVGLTGFKIHHSTGSYSHFERTTNGGTRGINYMIEKEGISLFIGDTSQIKPEWTLNGKPFIEEGTRYNMIGHWKPIISKKNVSLIVNQARESSDDERVQAALFYINTTGHKSFEFIIRTDKSLGNKEIFKYPRFNIFRNPHIELHHLRNIKSKSLIYDGTIYFSSVEPSDIQKSLQQLDKLVEKMKSGGRKITLILKYPLTYTPKLTPGSGGTFTISIKMNDPRGTLYASNERIFKTNKWHIKEDWLR